MKPLKKSDFDWVITVPAIWDAKGKRLMRESAFLVKPYRLTLHVYVMLYYYIEWNTNR